MKKSGGRGPPPVWARHAVLGEASLFEYSPVFPFFPPQVFQNGHQATPFL